MAQELPSGRVTFAFTDVVGSTRAFTEHGQDYADALPGLHRTIAAVAATHAGAVVKTEGDGAFLAFPTASAAVRALREMQARLEEPPAEGLWLRIRAGAHTGAATPIEGDYLALAVHVAARVSSTAGAGQVILSADVVSDLDAALLAETDPVDVGTFELKDIREPMQLWRAAGDDTPPRAMPASRTNVASPHSSFVSRERELGELGLLLDSPGLVTVLGPGGVGKTRLVSEYAVRHASERPGGIWMVELAPATDAQQVLGVVALTLGLAGQPTADRVAADLTRRGSPLLVLDNCEHVADAAADLVADLLAIDPDLTLAATSREPLEVHGERIQRLLPLAASEPEAAAALGLAGPAEELFLSRARSAGGEVASTDLPVVAEVCGLLDGLPLAIELAAARTAFASPPEILDQLRDGGLHLRRRGGEHRQRSLDALVGWSLDLLDRPHREALLALSVFPGRFSEDMARPVLDAVPGLPHAATAELTRRSLLDLDGTDRRMLVTVRDVARRELGGRPELREEAMAGLFRWAVDLSTRDVEDRANYSDQQVRALEEALAWALPDRRDGSGHVMSAIRAWSLAHLTSDRARDLAMSVVREPTPASADEIRLLAGAARLLGGMAFTEAPFTVDQARELVDAARRYAAGDTDLLFDAAHASGQALGRAGRFEEAVSLQLEITRLALSDRDRAVALTDVGVTYHLQGDLERAEHFYREGLAVAEGVDFNLNHIILMLNLGEVMLDAGRAEEAAGQLRATVGSAHGFETLHACALGLLVAAESERGAAGVARALAVDAEAALVSATRSDPSVAYVLERMRQALAALPA